MCVPPSRPAALSALLLCAVALAACASARERCVAPVAEDLATVRALIAETEAALARGWTYRVETRPVRIGVSYCAGGWDDGFRICGDAYDDVRRVPVAIDPEAERRKLAELRARETSLAAALPRAEAACAARYPG